MKYFHKSLLVFAVLMLCGLSLSACPLCGTTAESGGMDGDTNAIASGINTGILYLMAVPYLAFAAIAYFWYKASKKETNQKVKFQQVVKRILRRGE